MKSRLPNITACVLLSAFVAASAQADPTPSPANGSDAPRQLRVERNLGIGLFASGLSVATALIVPGAVLYTQNWGGDSGVAGNVGMLAVGSFVGGALTIAGIAIWSTSSSRLEQVSRTPRRPRVP